MEDAGDVDQVKTGFFASLESRREHWSLRMLRGAHVLRGARKMDWNTLAGTAKALLAGRTLETISIMEYVWERTALDATAATTIRKTVADWFGDRDSNDGDLSSCRC